MNNFNKKGILTKEEFYKLNDIYNFSRGLTPIFSDYTLNRILGKSDILNVLVGKGYIDEDFELITSKGLEALEAYRVKGAVIMAAGPSTRFIPLSLEQPKGLYEVKGEKLIERQIKQLLEVGIKDITLILGYKKEMFYYLKEKYGVRIIENDNFLDRNNTYSLYLAKDYLADSYICSCDHYFVENPFNTFEYDSFYAGSEVDNKIDEMYAKLEGDRIINMEKGLDKGLVLLGHSYWSKDFADTFIRFVIEDKDKKYLNKFWEWIVKDKLDFFPNFYYKKYAPRAIFEFDYFDQLRRFDSQYIKNSNSKIIKNIISVFSCNESEIYDFRNVNEGMTNISFIFKIKGKDYIYRHPGDGTESIINRKNEKNL